MKIRSVIGLAAVAVVIALPSAASASGIVVTPDKVPNATQGHSYTQALGWQADGATVSEPVTFALTSGALPNGFALTTTGLITGTTQALGPSSFAVTASDTAGHTGTRSYTLTVQPNIDAVTDLLGTVEGLLVRAVELVKCVPDGRIILHCPF